MFPPTYKYKIGSSQLDSKQRVPSYTDRILFQENLDQLGLLEYTSIDEVTVSDHKPVIALFQVYTIDEFQVKDIELMAKFYK